MPFTKQSAIKGGKASKRGKSKTTIEIRNTFTSILSDNETNIQRWLDKTADKDPGKAIDLIIKMASFIIPKHRAIEFDTNTKICHCQDLSLLTDEELEEQLHQANRVIYNDYDPILRRRIYKD